MDVGWNCAVQIDDGPPMKCNWNPGLPPESPAILLLNLAREIKNPRRALIDMTGYPMDRFRLARAKLSLDLDKAPPSLRIRALVEEWDYPRIIRELY